MIAEHDAVSIIVSIPTGVYKRQNFMQLSRTFHLFLDTEKQAVTL